MTDVVHKNISNGIDQHSSLTNIKEGYSESIINLDCSSSGYLNTRKGYEMHYGEAPIKVTRYEKTGTSMSFYLSSSQVLDLALVGVGPLIVYGKTSVAGSTGDITTTDSLTYYSTWSLSNRKSAPIGKNFQSMTPTQHGFTSLYLWSELAIADEATGNTNTRTIAEQNYTNISSGILFTEYDTNTAVSLFHFAGEFEPTAGSVHHETITTSTSVTITAVTHQLDNFFIQVRCFETDGTNNYEVIPNAVTIDANGEVIVDFEESFSGVAILVSTPNHFDGQAVAGTSTIEISNPGSPFNFVDAYYLDGSTYNKVIPNSVTYNETTDILTVEYYLVTGAESVSVYWTNASISNNILSVTDSSAVSGSTTDYNPQLTIWGISHENIYKDTTSRGGHISHLDSYKSAGTSELICGVGGSLFKELPRANASAVYSDGDPFMPSYVVNMNERTNGAVVIAPLFNSATTNRTRGEVVDTSILSNYAIVTSATYYDATQVDYVLTFDSAQTITGTIGIQDEIVITGLPYPELNGTFMINDGGASIINDNTTEVTIRCENLSASTRFNCTDTSGRLGCFTDSIELQDVPAFLANDAVGYSSTGAAEGLVLTTDADSTNIIVRGVDAVYDIADGLRFSVTRTTNEIYLRNLTGTAISENIVVHDKLTVEGYTRSVKVLSVNTTTHTVTIDESISITDGDTVSVEGRWWPIEIPPTVSDLAKDTYNRHFVANEYDQQPTIKSTIMNDTMFFTNGDDEVMKYDGTNITRAGLPRWQPMAFSTVDETVTSIVPVTISGTVGAVSGQKFTLGTGEASLMSIGDRVAHSQDGARYTVKSIYPDTDEVYVTSTISGSASGTLSRLVKYKYYFKVGLLDANNNIISSAVTSYRDAIVELASPSAVRWRLLGFPHFYMYDFDRLELQVFRALVDTNDYRLVGTKLYPVADGGNPYVEYLDTTPEEVLEANGEFDISLEGLELAVQAQGPVRAGFVSSANNRLILGNLKSYPRFDTTFGKVNSASAAVLDGIDLTFDASYSVGSTTPTVESLKFKILDGSEDVRTVSTLVDVSGRLGFTASGAALPTDLDWVYLYHATTGVSKDLDLCGWYHVRSISTNRITLDITYDASITLPSSCIIVANANEIPVFLGTDGNYGTIEGNSAGDISKASLRLSMAINAINTQLARPLFTASSGNDYNLGQIFIEQPYAGVGDSTITVTNPNATSTNVFMNGILRSNADVVDSDVLLYPSRVMQSYENFPEMFDNPTIKYDGGSVSVRDVNAQDGQSVASGLPFFGDSTFGSGRLNDVFVVFKSNSIYVYNTSDQAYQKLDSRGLGCTAPKSVATTRNGIMFANESGLYRLNRDLSVAYVGELIERTWKDGVNKSAIAEVVGHQYRGDRKYKVSVPTTGNSYSNNVLVYDHDSEGVNTKYGAWSKYDAHNVTMWANLDEDAYFGSFKGQVYKLRDAGDSSDFRDDEDAITVEWKYKAEDFGAPHRRKLIHKGFIEFQLDHTNLTGVELFSRTNLKGSYTSCGTITETQSDADYVPVRFSLADRKGVNVQMKLTHNVKDEEVVIVGISWVVGGLETTGVSEASSYSS